MTIFHKKYSDDIMQPEEGFENFGKAQLFKLYRFLQFECTDEELVQHIDTLYRFRNVPYNINLITAGTQHTKIYYMITGGVKVFRNDLNNVVGRLIGPGDLVGSSNSFLHKMPSDVTFKTTEESYMLELNVADIQPHLAGKFKIQYMKLFRRIEDMLMEYLLFMKTLIHFKNETRLVMVKEKFPDIFENFTSKDIASLLGMTPETFSRLTNKN